MLDTPGWSATSAMVVYLITFIVATIAAVLVAPLGLAVPYLFLWPLAVTFGTYVGALSAVWVANLMAGDGSRSDVLSIVLVSLLAGGFVGIGSMLLPIGAVVLNRAVVLLLCIAATSYVVTGMALRYRSLDRSFRFDVALTAVLLFLGVGGVAGSVFAVCSIGDCTA